jgi:hypothetical protein
MKYFLLLLTCSLSIAASAQKIRFTDTSNRWLVQASWAANPQEFDVGYPTYYLTGDTIVKGKHYAFLKRTSGYVPYSPPLLIREDIIARKVYAICLDTVSWPRDTVLYDYNLQVGDTVMRRANNKQTKFYVSSIDSVQIQGVYHRIWNMQAFVGFGYFTSTNYYSVIEGIGSTGGPWFPIFPYTFENAFVLHCFESHSMKPVVPVKVAGYFDNSTSCRLSVGGVTQSKAMLRAVPNPSAGSVELQIEGSHPEGAITVMSITGQIVYRQLLAEGQKSLSISTSSWLTGLYTICWQPQAGERQYEKLVIE